MNSKTLYQPVKLTKSMICNALYPLEIWFNVLQHLDLSSHKAFFETCWAFKSFCTRNLINKVAHKADSLYTMLGKKLDLELERFLSLDLLLSELQKLSDPEEIPLGIYSRRDVPFSAIKRFGNDCIANISSYINKYYSHIICSCVIRRSEVNEIMSLIVGGENWFEENIKDWVFNTNITWEELKSIIQMEIFSSSSVALHECIPLKELLEYEGVYWSAQNMSGNPNITLEYMLDNPNHEWSWIYALAKKGWSPELVTRFLTLEISNPVSKGEYAILKDKLEAICLGKYESTNSSFGYLHILGSPLILDSYLLGYVPKGYVRDFLKHFWCDSERDEYFLSEMIDSITPILRYRVFDEDELRGVIEILYIIGEEESEDLWWILSYNPSLTPSFIESLGEEVLSKLCVTTLLSNPSFGFLDILEVLEYQKIVC